MDCSTPGFPVHYLLEFAQIHVHSVSDAIQPSHPLSPPFPPTFNLYQHQGLFQIVALHISGQSIDSSASASVLQMNIQDWCPLGLTGLSSLPSKGFSRVFCNSTIQKHQSFFSTQPSLQSILTSDSITRMVWFYNWSEVKWSHSVMSDSLRPHGL